MESENSSQKSKQNRKKRLVWSSQMELLLLSIWEENSADLRSSKKNSHVYLSMEKAFNDNGVNNICASEIKTKIANLSKMYR